LGGNNGPNGSGGGNAGLVILKYTPPPGQSCSL
jgi:hypothetical protein